MGKTASLRRVFKHDYPCFTLTLVGSLLVVFTVIISVTGDVPSKRKSRKADPAFARGALVVTAGAAAVLGTLAVGRWSRIRRIVAAGQETDATVLKITFFKDRARVEFEYDWEGTRHVGRHAVMKTDETRALVAGVRLRLAVDPLKPSRAIPVDLFVRAG